jgi:hypothetical protein
MATHDYIISNASGAAVRADLNNALAAIATNNSSATEPTTTYAYQWWADTGSSPTVMKLRNAANSAWITLFQLDGEWSLIPFENGTAAAPSIYFKDSGTDTGLFSGGTDQVNITTGGTERVEWGTSEVVFNDSGANYDFRIEGDTNANLFFVDASADAVGIRTTSPGATLDVNGKLRLSSTEDSQLEWVTGAQTWRSNVVSGGKWYLYDVTNAKFPLDVSANSTCKLDINTSHVAFTTNASERARIDSSGRLLVGTSTARSNFFNTTFATSIQLEGTTSVSSSLSLVSNRSTAEQFDQPVLVLGRSGGTAIGNNTVVANTNAVGSISFQGNDGTEFVALAEITAFVDGTPGANDMPGRLVFSTTADGASSPTERVRITNDGYLLVGTTNKAPRDISGTTTGQGVALDNGPGGFIQVAGNGTLAFFNRVVSDGGLIDFRQDGAIEGNISVSGTTVFFNGAHLARWSQLANGAQRVDILRGSVLSNLDEMCEWGEEANEQLNRMKISDVDGDPNVAGVFISWDDDDDTYTDDFYCAMTGDFIIRIAEGVTVQRGDLLMSAGDGTAKPQDDDIIRSKTVAKVTSTHVTCTYEDGSYCVPCVLMAC